MAPIPPIKLISVKKSFMPMYRLLAATSLAFYTCFRAQGNNAPLIGGKAMLAVSRPNVRGFRGDTGPSSVRYWPPFEADRPLLARLCSDNRAGVG